MTARKHTFAIETNDGEDHANDTTTKYNSKIDADNVFDACVKSGKFYGVSYWVDGICTHFFANGSHYTN